MIATGGTVGLAEGIIDDTCFVSHSIHTKRELRIVYHDHIYGFLVYTQIFL